MSSQKKTILQLLIANEKIHLSIDDPFLFEKIEKKYEHTFYSAQPHHTIKIIKGNTSEVAFDKNRTVIYYPRTYKFVNLLFQIRFILQKVVLEKKILFLHGSSFIYKDKGYVFCGRSGIGKSTIIKKAPHQNILSDDQAVLKQIHHKFYIYPSIFDKVKYSIITQEPEKLHKIFFLKQSLNVKILQLNINESIKRILRNTIIYKKMDILSSAKTKNIIDKKRKDMSNLRDFYQLIFDLALYTQPQQLDITKGVEYNKFI